MAIIERQSKTGVRYRVVIRDTDGKQVSVGTFGDKREAKRAERAGFKPRQTVYPAVKRGKLTVAGYAREWLPAHKLSDHGRNSYMSTLRASVIPEIGSTPLTEVTPHTIRTWFRRLEDEGASGARLAKIKTVTSALFQTAAEDGLITANPVRGIKIKKDPRKRRHALTAEEYRAVIEAIPDHYKLLVETIVSTGLRWEEAMALRGTDVEGNMIHVTRVLNELSYPARFAERDGTKNGKSRDVKIPAGLAMRLRAAGTEFVFLRPDGSHIPGNYFRSKVWHPIMESMGLAGVTPRDMRRTHATLLRAGGADLEVVRTRLGHSSLSVSDRYLDERPETQDDALEALSAA